LLLGLVFTVAVMSMYGCAGSGSARLPDPASLSQGGEADVVRLTEGRSLYLAECASCHNRVWPDERSPDEWPEILARHEDRVPVSSDGFDNIRRYVILASREAVKHR